MWKKRESRTSNAPCVVCLVILVYSLNVFSQSLSYRRDQNVNGWPVPNLTRLRTTTFEGPTYTERTYSLGNSKPSTRLAKNKYCEFSHLFSYSYKDKLFAIDGTCVIFILSKGKVFSKGKRGYTHFISKEYMAAITRFTFYDEDGDGKFETRYRSSPLDRSFRILVPKYLLN